MLFAVHLRRFLLISFLQALTLVAQTEPAFQAIEANGKTLGYKLQGGFAIVQGDIILGRAEEIENYRQSYTRSPAIALPQSIHAVFGATGAQLWPNATMYYTIDTGTLVQQNLLDGIAYWNQVGNFKILPRDGQPNYVTFQNVATDAACESYIGMTGGQQIIGITSNCSVGSVIHELGHAWGLEHEHVRSDRAGHITILYDNIDKRYYSDFNQSRSFADVGYYDFDSVMHYPAYGFSRNFNDTIETVPPGIPIGQRSVLSAGDIDGVSRLYGFVPSATTIATAPAGLPILVDGISAISPQSYQWAPGSQHTVSVPVTQGTAPRYVFAGWSDAGLAAHTLTASSDITVFCANFSRQFPVQASVASGSGAVSLLPFTTDNYLPDRSSFLVTATPSPGAQFVRWIGTTYLASSGLSVSATPASVEVQGVSSNYQATFATTPLSVVDSQPEGAAVLVDGASYFTPASFAWLAGSKHVLGYNSPQLQGTNSLRFQFLNWEDGSIGSRTVTASAQPATYIASFLKQYLLTTYTIGPGSVSASPPSADGFYEANSQVQLFAAPASGQYLRYWIGDAAGTSTQQSVVMDQERLATAYFGTQYPWLELSSASYGLNTFYGNAGQSVAPGEIVSFFGSNIGPATAVLTAADTSGRLPTDAGGVSVLFDKFPAPVTYASPNQINVVVPYELAGQTSTAISIANNGSASSPFGISVFPTLPGLFTANGTGTGPVAALNQDLSLNSAQNPIAAGSIVVLYATGAGAMNNFMPDGQITGANTSTPVAAVYVRIGKVPAEILYAGSAPSLVSGALQVNVRVPSGTVGGGQVPIQLIVGEYTSPPGTTIWVQ
jgi:uncharacterized protein (TIGR03437 family)